MYIVFRFEEELRRLFGQVCGDHGGKVVVVLCIILIIIYYLLLYRDQLEGWDIGDVYI